jgi:uncharacterized Ntn-hydrolase superfamily protein
MKFLVSVILFISFYIISYAQVEPITIPAYSIIGWDSLTGDMGVAVVSKFPCVGSIVPYAKANVGVIVTQNIPNPDFGNYGIKMLEQRINSQQVIEELIKNTNVYQLQLAALDVNGNTYAYTGNSCKQYAGHYFSKSYSVQGTELLNASVLRAMGMTFEMTQGDLAERLLSAIESGAKANGEQSNEISACLLVVRENGGFNEQGDRFIDIRIDNDSLPLQKLRRIYEIWQEKFLIDSRLQSINKFNRNKKFVAAETEKKRLVELFNIQLKRKPDDPDLLNKIAWTLAFNDIDPLQALELAKRAIKLSPERLDILNTLAECHYRMKHYEEAIAIGSELIKRDPSNEVYWKQLQKFREAKEKAQ